MLFNERQDSVEAQYTGAVLEGYGQRALLLKIYGHLPDRNLKVYTLKACKAIGLHYIEFWRLGTILQGVLQGTLPSPCGESRGPELFRITDRLRIPIQKNHKIVVPTKLRASRSDRDAPLAILVGCLLRRLLPLHQLNVQAQRL